MNRKLALYLIAVLLAGVVVAVDRIARWSEEWSWGLLVMCGLGLVVIGVPWALKDDLK